MKIAIMQPYFFPYLGYFSLIKATDEFILFDPVQFIRHGWIERNRVLKPDKGWQYIGIPIQKHNQTTLIKDIKTNDNEDWRNKILRQLEHYKKKSPYYNQTIEVVARALKNHTQSVVELNQSILKEVCAYLQISFKCRIFSEMRLAINPVNAPDEWALNICNALGINEYWNPPGGTEFFDRSKYEKNGVKLVFQKPLLEAYSQRRGAENFEIGLSIIDIMMFNSIEEINTMLDKYELF
jgi:hypothetical protein